MRLVVLLFVLLTPFTAMSAEIEPPDVFQQITLLQNELETIRKTMGKPAVEEAVIRAVKATPGNVYYHAGTLYYKTSEFAEEFNQFLPVEPPYEPIGEPKPADVFALVTASLKQVRMIKAVLELGPPAQPPPRDSKKEPRDVLNAIITTNRQLNRMSNSVFPLSRNYHRVKLATEWVAGIRQSQGLEPFPPMPDLVKDRYPPDVYEELLGCLELIVSVGAKVGSTELEFRPRRGELTTVDSTLVLSELAEINRITDPPYPGPNQAPQPRYIYPMHVLQMSKLLRLQLQGLSDSYQ